LTIPRPDTRAVKCGRSRLDASAPVVLPLIGARDGQGRLLSDRFAPSAHASLASSCRVSGGATTAAPDRPPPAGSTCAQRPARGGRRRQDPSRLGSRVRFRTRRKDRREPAAQGPTSRLLGVVAGVAVAAGSGAAIAGAVGGGAAPPPSRSRSPSTTALAAPALQGVHGAITFNEPPDRLLQPARGDPCSPAPPDASG